MLLLSGCTVATPLPLTPIQILEGTWPAPVQAVAVANRSYTIKGDTFAYPALGLAVTRASQRDWEFMPGNNAVIVRFRVHGDEPRPSLSVQLIDIPPGTDLGAALGADKQTLEQQGATVTASAATVSGLAGEAWAIEQTDAEAGVTVRMDRLYVPLPGGMLALIQTQASKETYEELAGDFEKMLQAIILPGTQ